MEKEKHSNRRVALIYFLIAGFAIPLVVKALVLFSHVGYKLNLGLKWMQDGGGIFPVLLWLLNEAIFDILPIWIGVFLSVKMLGRKFFDNKNRVMRLSTGYFIIFIFCLFLFYLFMPLPIVYFLTLFIAASSMVAQNFSNFTNSVIASCIIMVLTFYFLNRTHQKKYLSH